MKHQGMRERSRQTLIDRVVKVTGRTDCTEVVVLQRRERWVMPLVAGLVAVTMTVANLLFDLNVIVGGAIVGAVVGGALTVLMTGHWLASCGDTIVLVQTAKRMSGPHVEVGEWPYPVAASLGRGFGAQRVTLDGQSFIMARQFAGRFRTITGAS